MKIRNLSIVLLIGMLIGLNPFARAQESSVDPFLGTWALDPDYESNRVGWIEISQEKAYIDAEVLWRWGGVYPVDFVYVEGDHLFIMRGKDVVREKDKAGKAVRTQHQISWFEMKKEGDDILSGIAYFPNRNSVGIESVSFTGKRLPDNSPAPDLSKVKYGKPAQIFNSQDLSGWKVMGEDAVNGWKVMDGIMVNDPVQKEGEEHIHYGNLRTIELFEDFNLTLEVNVPEGSNSGIYLRGIYEVQVMDSYEKPLGWNNMGALYSRIVPAVSAEKPAGNWQKMDITLYKRHLTVVLNDQIIIDNQAVKGVTGGALTSDEFIPGPIYLQGDHGKVSYRNFVLTPILE